jgi:hypothetical protein
MTARRSRALTGISTCAVSLDTAVVNSSGSAVPAGIVTIRTVGTGRGAAAATRGASAGMVRGAAALRTVSLVVARFDVPAAALLERLVEASLFEDTAGWSTGAGCKFAWVP